MAGKGNLTIVGLGNGSEDDLTLGVWHILKEADTLYLRTADHPVAHWLKRQGIAFSSFDAVYVAHDRFTEVYDRIVGRLIAEATQSPVVYAVPGHPMVAEQTTKLLLAQGKQAGIDVEIKGGRSFIEQVFTAFRLDPIDGFLVLDALDLMPERLDPHVATIIVQVYDQLTASDVKLTLMERYPDDYGVTIGHALGIPQLEKRLDVPLYLLDHHFPVSSLSMVYIPAMP